MMKKTDDLKTAFASLFNPLDIGKESTISINEVLAYAAQEQVKKSSEDTDKIMLLVIDQQRSFMENGELGVPGSFGDTERLGHFLYHNMNKITQIVMTKDVHRPIQIFHPCWWKNSSGEAPRPIETVITVEDVENGVWIPQYDAEQSLAYLKQLRAGGKRELRIWPYHCLEGTSGVEIESQFMNLVYFHSVVRESNPIILAKGQDRLSEMYGAFYHEDGKVDEENKGKLDAFGEYEKIYVAGQALSHCVLDTLKQLIKHVEDQPSYAKRIYLLMDCSSVIPGSEEVTKQEIRHLVNKYGINVVQSAGLII